MLGKLTGENETDTRYGVRRCVARFLWMRTEDIRGLDLARGDGRLLVVGSKLGGLGSNALEDI